MASATGKLTPQIMKNLKRVIEEKHKVKRKLAEIGDKVVFFAVGAEGKEGKVTNTTEWKGERVFEVEFLNGKKKWGSIMQVVKKVDKTDEII